VTRSASSWPTSGYCRPRPAPTSSSSATPPTCAPPRPARVAHFEGEILTRNIVSFLAGQPLGARFDGHTNCFIESGSGRALLIDFNYDTEPVTGRFPGRVGLPLLRETRLNHLGKLTFEWLYWHMLDARIRHPGHRNRHAAGRQAARGAYSRQPRSCQPGQRHERKGLIMPVKIYAGTEVTVNAEGFFSDPRQWREDKAPEIAADNGISALTEPHWQVVKFMRHEYAENGTGPSVRALSNTSGVSIKEPYELFPKGPASWPPRSPAFPSRAAASERAKTVRDD
jgi:TusE/DsrC/DsvC family sulfur relay protein